MLNYEGEIRSLRAGGLLDDDETARLIAIERRERFSVDVELRLMAYAAVLAIVTGVGLFLKDHYDEIGPVAVIAFIGAAAAGCYFFALRRWDAASGGTLREYALLLAGLLVSADLGFAESQFHMLGSEWTRHLLLLTLFHGLIAYGTGSKMTLSLSLASLAAWFGIHRNVETFFQSGAWIGTRALECAALLFVWRLAHARLFRNAAESGRLPRDFSGVFEHFIANLALWGAMLWCFNENMRWTGAALMVVLASLSWWWAWRTGREMFLLYAVAYGYIGVSAVLLSVVEKLGPDFEALGFLYFIVTVPVAVTLLIVFWRRLGRES